MKIEQKNSTPLLYLLGGAVIGAVAGVLFAPRIGTETRNDLLSRIRRAIPTRIKVAGAYGAVKGAAHATMHEAREKISGYRS